MIYNEIDLALVDFPCCTASREVSTYFNCSGPKPSPLVKAIGDKSMLVVLTAQADACGSVRIQPPLRPTTIPNSNSNADCAVYIAILCCVTSILSF